MPGLDPGILALRGKDPRVKPGGGETIASTTSFFMSTYQGLKKKF
jgi:hypothetical protein